MSKSKLYHDICIVLKSVIIVLHALLKDNKIEISVHGHYQNRIDTRNIKFINAVDL